MTTKLPASQIETPSGAFFSGGGTPVTPALRHPGRFFLGLGHEHNQATDGGVTGGSWLQSFASTGSITPVTAWDYFEDVSRGASVSDFGIAYTGATRNRGVDGIGMVGAVLADAATYNGWAFYADAVRVHATAGSVSGIEVNASQIPGTSPGNSGITEFWRKGKTPYKAPVSGEVIGIGGSAGSDEVTFGRSYAVDAWANIGNNGAAFWAGIVFRFDAIMREGVADDRSSPGNTGYARAISMATEQGLSWYSRDPSGAPGSGTQDEVIRLFSNVTSAAHRASFFFSDAGMEYRERTSPTGHAIFTATYNGDVTAGVRIVPGYTGSPAAVIEAHKELGGDANLIARGAGSGLFGFGTWVSSSDAAVNGYITIVDRLGNTRKLATIA